MNEKTKKKTKTQLLIELVSSGCELWNGGDQVAYATFQVGNHLENWKVKSRRFLQWVTGCYCDTYHDVPSRATYDTTIPYLEHLALQGKNYPTYRRVARVDDTLFIDIGNDKWECVEVTASGWQVIKQPPLKFLRCNNTGALPTPEMGGSIDELQPLVTASAENWQRMKGFILDAFKGFKPYFALAVHGCQGSAKSYACTLIKTIIDPVKKGSSGNFGK
jgi:hypothetical protein